MGLIAIGDLHGCSRTLDALLGRLAPRPSDHVVFVGDYVDRGPDSRGVIERLLRMEAAAMTGRGPACTFLRGNHDQMVLDYVAQSGGNGTLDLWRANGGLKTLMSYADTSTLTIPDDHLAFLRRTALFYDTPQFLFVHAGLNPARSVAENLADGTPRTFLWERTHLNAEQVAWEKTVVCGHTPVPEPVDRPHLINIDTGAVYPHIEGLGTLTAVRLPERVFVQVPYSG